MHPALCRRSRARIIISSSVSAMFDLDRISIGGPSGLWLSRDVVAMTSLNCIHLNRSSDIVAPVQRSNRSNFKTLYVWFPEPSPCRIPSIAVKHGSSLHGCLLRRPLCIPSRWDKPPRRAVEKLEERCTSSCISYRTLTVAKPATSSLSSRGLADTPGRAIEWVLHQ